MFIAYVWPKVKEGVDRDREKIFEQMGKSISREVRNMVTSQPTHFIGPPTEGSWNAIADLYSKIAREQVQTNRQLSLVERPVSMIRDAVFAVILADFLFLLAAGISFTLYESWGILTSFAGGFAIAYFLFKVASMWDVLSK